MLSKVFYGTDPYLSAVLRKPEKKDIQKKSEGEEKGKRDVGPKDVTKTGVPPFHTDNFRRLKDKISTRHKGVIEGSLSNVRETGLRFKDPLPILTEQNSVQG